MQIGVPSEIKIEEDRVAATPDGVRELVARGEQQVACMQREGEHVVPVPVPPQLREALREYAS